MYSNAQKPRIVSTHAKTRLARDYKLQITD